MNRYIFRSVAVWAIVLTVPLIGAGQERRSEAALDAQADKILKAMSVALASHKQISFDSHAIADQYTPDGQKVQYAKNQKVLLRRPDRLSVDVTGDVEDLRFRYDGKRVTLYNPRTKSFGAAAMPASIDETLDTLADKYGMALPLADLVFADPYKSLTESLRSSQYLGIGYVFDVRCHHLAFRQASSDWQIWVEEGDKPLPRKMVITVKESPGHPQYTAFLSNWNLAAEAPDSAFAFDPPAGAKRVEFAPSTRPAAAADRDKP
jgi:hypothetical protein